MGRLYPHRGLVLLVDNHGVEGRFTISAIFV